MRRRSRAEREAVGEQTVRNVESGRFHDVFCSDSDEVEI